MKKLRSRESNRLFFSLSVLSLSYSLARFALLRGRAQKEQLKANYWRGKYYISLSLSLSQCFFFYFFFLSFLPSLLSFNCYSGAASRVSAAPKSSPKSSEADASGTKSPSSSPPESG